MKLDTYTKIILTIIAGSLLFICVNISVQPIEARAQSSQKIDGMDRLVDAVRSIDRTLDRMYNFGLKTKSNEPE
jgi:hypothetical protein